MNSHELLSRYITPLQDRREAQGGGEAVELCGKAGGYVPRGDQIWGALT